MEYYHNPGKALEIEVAGERYLRHGIRTHFVEVGEDYLDLFRRYVVPVYRPGDWVAVSEKVAALCQGRVIHRQEIQVTWLARLLAKCVRQTPAGPGMGLPVKMQFALDQEGRARVLWAALRAGLDKLRFMGPFTVCWGRRSGDWMGSMGRTSPPMRIWASAFPRSRTCCVTRSMKKRGCRAISSMPTAWAWS